ncbi:hypothetical protein NDU88_002128 [Pleurodeles waltl]|uniref:CLOCK-interacting pacemaker n=1 Tax=Pleurodeles waltl TaxID=8319 RepID=A0AAV7MQH8_PLEWA|nr:hypothetical protein NDU88_002128 [Pleurodeles waltl]
MEGEQLAAGGHKSAQSRLSRLPRMKQRALYLGMATAESDKDSGFSDGASDCQSSLELVDSEDVRSVLCWSAKDGTVQNPGTKNSSFTGLSPVLMMKNVFFRQANASVPQSWAVHPPFEVTSQSQPQILFLPSAAPTLLSPPTSSERRGYLPILNSYAKIAPQPNKEGSVLHGNETNNADGPSKQKRLCVEKHETNVPGTLSRKSSTLSINSDSLSCKNHLLPSKSDLLSHSADAVNTSAQKSGKGAVLQSSSAAVASSPAPTLLSSASIDMPMDSVPIFKAGQSQTSKTAKEELPSVAKMAVYISPPAGEVCSSSELSVQDQQSKSKRFQNTLDVLHKSGLLEITMKTKELARQNRATQAELDLLKEQVQLLMEAMQSSLPQAWAKLHESLSAGAPKTESGLADGGILQVSLESFGM